MKRLVIACAILAAAIVAARKQSKGDRCQIDDDCLAEASGGDGCKRLAAGTFAVRRADNPRQIYMEATYRDASGAIATVSPTSAGVNL